jgi:hypothetical protein
MFNQNMMMPQNMQMGMNQRFPNQPGNMFPGNRMMGQFGMQPMNPMQNRMNMMQMPGMQNQFGRFPGQMGRPMMMPYGQQMMGFNRMGAFPMNNQMQNPMMMGNPQFGNMMNPGMNQYQMLPPGHQGMNRLGNQNKNSLQDNFSLDPAAQNTYEDQAISALANTDYKANNDDNDLFNDIEGEDVKDNVDIGEFNLNWVLDEGDTEEELKSYTYFTEEEIKMIINRNVVFDQLYLVKWMNLSYNDCTWEPLSLIHEYDELLEDFEIRNKKIDKENRNKLINHRKTIIKIVEHLGISEKRRK